MYLRIVGSLVPRELIAKREQAPDSDYAELTDEEVIEMIEAERRRTLVQRVMKSLP
jgi:DNA primase large subunit